MKKAYVLSFICVLSVFSAYGAGLMAQALKSKETVESRLRQYKDAVHKKLLPEFKKNGVRYPPSRMLMVGLKEEKLLEIWVASGDADLKLLKTYPILGSSGKAGPKLREGDRQVPEGLYKIEFLNPNSRFHLSLRVNYPNEFDLKRAGEDGRENPGSDIMIHGNTCSIGCLAMGDEAIEEIFVMAAETGIGNISLILSPLDLRKRPAPDTKEMPPWTVKLYAQIKDAFPKPGKAGSR